MTALRANLFQRLGFSTEASVPPTSEPLRGGEGRGGNTSFTFATLATSIALDVMSN